MKRIIIICAILFLPSLLVLVGGSNSSLARIGGGGLFAQLSGISYQAVAVDETGKGIPGMDIDGQVIPNAAISIRFSILEASASGTLLYQETHTTNTDMYGLFSLVIGTGTVSSSGQYPSLAQIPWQTANQFLKVELDIKNDGNYKLVSIQQLMAVPYAFFAAKSDTAVYALNAAPASSGITGWSLTGNDTTNVSVNFIGTRDSVDFVVKTNNAERVRVTADGYIGIGTSSAPTNKLQIGNTPGTLGHDFIIGNGTDILAINVPQGSNAAAFSSTTNFNFIGAGGPATGNVGIGVQDPAARLAVSGSGNDNSTFGLKVVNSSGDPGMVVRDDGLVGIGTTAPEVKLSVAGTLGVSEEGSTGGRLQISSGGAGAVLFQNDNSSIIFKTLSGVQEKMRIRDEGDVGIGTATPAGKFHINNDSVGSDSSFVVLQSGNVGLGTITPGARLEVAGQVKITGGVPGSGKVLTSDATGLASWETGTFPYTLGNGLSLSGSMLNSVWTVSGADIYNNNSGKVGIGTAAPDAELEVVSTSSASPRGIIGTQYSASPLSGAQIWLRKGRGTEGAPASIMAGDEIGSLKFRGFDGSAFSANDQTEIGAVASENFSSSANGSYLKFMTTPNGSLNGFERMRISENGNIGIGTTSPGALLELAGQVKITGGSPGAGKILTSDAAGLATWEATVFPYTLGNGLSLSNDTLNSVWSDSSGNIYNNNAGNVGIGTAVPTEKLEVAGNTKISGLAGTGIRMVQADSSGLLIPLAADSVNKVLLGTGVWGNVPTNTAWGLNGNSGTVDGANFIGTTDSIPFNVRVYNQKAGRIDPAIGTTFWGYKAGYTGVSGTYNTGVGEEALYSNTTGAANTAMGAQTLYSNTIGLGNVALGVQALFANTTGNGNVGLGGQSLYSNTTGNGNVAGGGQALYSNTTGEANIALGPFSLFSNTTGQANIAIGDSVLYSSTTANYNLGIGTNALFSNTLGTNNVGIGTLALYWNTTGSGNLAEGYKTLYANTTGEGNTALGSYALKSNTTGGGNVAIGPYTMIANTSGYKNIAIGDSVLYSNTTGYQNISVGSKSLHNNTTGYANSAFGTNSLQANTTGYTNTASGISSLYSNTTGFANTGLGYGALYRNTTANRNTATGFASMFSNTTGDYNAGYGFYSLFANTTGIQNTALGMNTLASNTTGNGNTAAGLQALYTNTTGEFNTATGAHSLFANDTGKSNTAIGYAALNANLNSNNTALGATALYSNTTGEGNTATGYSSLYNNTTGSSNTATGRSALNKNTTGTDNTAIGRWAIYSNTTGSSNTAAGRGALYSNTTGMGNTASGMNALYKNITGSYNTAAGDSAMYSNTTGSNNTASGRLSMYKNTIGKNNSSYGVLALYNNSFGNDNAAFGFLSLYSNTAGQGNTAIGDSSLYSNTIGSYNVATGAGALKNNTTGLYNNAFGVGALYLNSTGNYNTAVGTGALAVNNTGTENVAVGNAALYSNVIGNYNVVAGNDAMKNSVSGSNNTAIGTNALKQNISGISNTALGYGAFDLGTAYSNSTAIGFKAQVTGDNMVQLGDGNITLVNTSGTMAARGYTTAISSKGSDYTLTATDDIVAVSGLTTITLPDATQIAGRKYTIKSIDVQFVTVNTVNAQTIDGGANVILTSQYDFITVVSDGNNWLVVGN